MLQILSGKFFNEDEFTKNTVDKSIFYSYTKILDKIETDFWSLEPIDLNIMFGISSYLITINGKTPIRDHAPNHPSAMNQFKVLLSFWCYSMFDFDKSNVELLCRELPNDSKDELIPSKIVPTYFSQDNVFTDSENFSNFIKKLLNLSRKRYDAILESITTFYQALNALNYNLELAFSLMVFSIESLSQKFDGYKNNWDNYNNSVKSYLNKLVDKYEITESDYKELKHVLLKEDYQKLSKRYVDFSLKHIDDSFFKHESKNVKSPLNKSDLKKVLKNSYNIRSKYVHELKRFNDTENLYSTKFSFEIVEDETDIFLTFSGLTRIVHHILKNFILQSDDGIEEEIDFDKENPNMVTINVSPEYWITDVNFFTPEKIFRYFYNFLILFPHLEKNDMDNFKELMLKIEKSLNSTKKQLKPPLVIFYYLCNTYHYNGDITGNFKKTCDKHSINNIMSKLRIETLLCKLLLKEEITWDLQDVMDIYSNYENNKFKKLILKLPHYMELLILIYISNENKQNLVNFYIWCDKLICDLPSKTECQKYIQNCISNNEHISLQKFNELYFINDEEKKHNNIETVH